MFQAFKPERKCVYINKNKKKNWGSIDYGSRKIPLLKPLEIIKI